MNGTLEFTLPAELEAHRPPVRRDDVRLLVGQRSTGTIGHHEFRDLPDLLRPGDLLVVNTSATLPAAVHLDKVAVHFSTPLPGSASGASDPGLPYSGLPDSGLPDSGLPDPGLPDSAGDVWLVELRRRAGKSSVPYKGGSPNEWIPMPGGATLTLIRRHTERLWAAHLSTSVVPYLLRYGTPIRYGYVRQDWPTSAYQTVFADVPGEGTGIQGDRMDTGSAEMPSAARPFTPELVTRLVSRGVLMAPLTLHTGVASPEAHEPPYAERYEVPASTAALVEHVRRPGPGEGRVIAVGTTVVRALETAVDGQGHVRPSQGWTEHIVTPEQGVRAVDGLLTGLHEPRSSHLMMLAAIAGDTMVKKSYEAALAERYLWHEFGDLTLFLP
jgi:S-adenosylmethionine:tRNA-ribosyltransferase-isomerase (queuine synthetase)